MVQGTMKPGRSGASTSELDSEPWGEEFPEYALADTFVDCARGNCGNLERRVKGTW